MKAILKDKTEVYISFLKNDLTKSRLLVFRSLRSLRTLSFVRLHDSWIRPFSTTILKSLSKNHSAWLQPRSDKNARIVKSRSWRYGHPSHRSSQLRTFFHQENPHFHLPCAWISCWWTILNYIICQTKIYNTSLVAGIAEWLDHLTLVQDHGSRSRARNHLQTCHKKGSREFVSSL